MRRCRRGMELSLGERWRSLAATSIAHFINDGTLFIFPMIYPLLISYYGLSKLHVGVVAGVLYLASVLASPFVGSLSDRSRRFAALLALGIAMMAFGIMSLSAATLYLSGFPLFLALKPRTILVGIGSAFYHPLAATILAEKWESYKRGFALGVNGAFGSLGRATYPTLVVMIVSAFALMGLTILAIAALVAAALVFAMLRDLIAVQPRRGKRHQQEGSMRSVLSISLIALTISAFIRSTLTQGAVQFIPTYLVESRGMSYDYFLGIVISIMLVMGIVGQPIFGSLVDKIGGRMALSIAVLGAAAMLLMLVVDRTSPFMLLYLAGFGFFAYTGFPLLLSLSTDVATHGTSTTAGSIVWGVGATGGAAAGPVIVALLGQRNMLGSLDAAFTAIAILGILSILLLPLVRAKPHEA